jgi:hypothetical protein
MFVQLTVVRKNKCEKNHGFLLENQWVYGKTCFEFPIEVKYGKIWRLFFYKKFLSLVEGRQAWYWEIGNVAKGAIFKKFRFSIINWRMKKLPKQDEFGILG